MDALSKWAPLLLTALALLVRAVYLMDLRHAPLFLHPQMDMEYHDRWALRLAGGDWLGEEVFFRAPLYPYFLGVLYALFGHDLLVPRLVQLAIGGLATLLVIRLGTVALSRPAGLLAGFLYAIYGIFVYFEGELLIVVLEVFLDLAVLVLLYEAERRGTLRRDLAAGVAMGLAAVARPNILAFLPCVLLFYGLRRRAPVRRALLFLAGAAVVIAPVLARNWIVGRDLVPIASQGGINFYIGNNPASDGMSAIAPGMRPDWYGGYHDAIRLAEEAEGRRLLPSEVSDHWLRRGFAFFREEPGRALALTGKKLVLFWTAFEIPNNQNFYFFSRDSRLFRWHLLPGFGLLAPLGLLGLVLLAREPGRYVLLLTFTAAYVLSVVAFFVCDRYRVPVIPVLLVAGAHALLFLRGLALARDARRLAAWGALLLGFALFVNVDWYGVRKGYNFAQSHLRLAAHWTAEGEPGRAESEYRAAILEESGNADARTGLGIALAAQGRRDEARRAFEEALAASPSHVGALTGLAAWEEAGGNFPAADSLLRRALAANPDAAPAVYNLGLLRAKTGNDGEAIPLLERAAALTPEDPAPRLRLAEVHLHRRDLVRAAEEAERALSLRPGDPEALFFRGAAAWAKGDREAARADLERAVAANPALAPRAALVRSGFFGGGGESGAPAGEAP